MRVRILTVIMVMCLATAAMAREFTYRNLDWMDSKQEIAKKLCERNPFIKEVKFLDNTQLMFPDTKDYQNIRHLFYVDRFVPYYNLVTYRSSRDLWANDEHISTVFSKDGRLFVQNSIVFDSAREILTALREKYGKDQNYKDNSGFTVHHWLRLEDEEPETHLYLIYYGLGMKKYGITFVKDSFFRQSEEMYKQYLKDTAVQY